ncbi:MAG: pyridoxamine 5'-phosphate oxidase family protein [Ilumatobacteraceae bacterium]
MPADHQYPSGPARVTVVVGRDLPRASGADAVRTMVDGATQGTLSTLAVDPAGFPFGSIVSFAPDAGGDPLFVISQLAEHTRNLTADPRASLLVAEPAPDGDSTADPLARGRVTLIGETRIVPDEAQSAAVDIVAARIPAVAGYAGYGDFACYRLAVQAIRWVGGFGEMAWIDVEAYRDAAVDPVLPRRHGISQHMNDDHADAGILLCQQALVVEDPSTTRTVTKATMRHVDRFGCEYVADLDDGALGIIRLGFSGTAASADDVRRLVVELVQQARGA